MEPSEKPLQYHQTVIVMEPSEKPLQFTRQCHGTLTSSITRLVVSNPEKPLQFVVMEPSEKPLITRQSLSWNPQRNPSSITRQSLSWNPQRNPSSITRQYCYGTPREKEAGLKHVEETVCMKLNDVASPLATMFSFPHTVIAETNFP